MMIGERNHQSVPTVHVPPWTFPDESTAGIHFSLSPNGDADYPFFHHNDDVSDDELDLPLDAYSCDHFRMYEFKVRKCARVRSHDWTDCPYAHPGEKARRRDPRKYNYSGTACPDFRKGNCKKGDGCEFAHGVFECWLHPTRYRTQPCKDGQSCTRKICFFAHTPEQFRVLSPRMSATSDSYDGSPRRLCFEGSCSPSESPPISPMSSSLSRSLGSNSVSEMVASLRQLQLNKVKLMPSSWALQMASSSLGSPRQPMIRSGFCSLPSTPTQVMTRTGSGFIDMLDEAGVEEEPVMERVESGRGLRAKMFEKLSKENPLGRNDPNPDVDWVSDLVQ